MLPASEAIITIAMTLYDDEAKCLITLNEAPEHGQDNSHPCYRTFIRAACAVIEGATFCIKRTALETYRQANVTPEPAELFLLLEESYRLKDNGEIAKPLPLNIPLLNNIKFSFKTYARAHGVEFDICVQEKGWKDLEKAKKIRNNLMHPKEVAHLLLSKDDADVVAKASIWYGRKLVSLLRCCNPSMEDKIAKFERQLNGLEQLHKTDI